MLTEKRRRKRATVALVEAPVSTTFEIFNFIFCFFLLFFFFFFFLFFCFSG
jgi:hypothetical protein